MVKIMSKGLPVLMLLTMLCCASMAFEGPGEKHQPPRPEKMMEKLAADLGLTQQQKDKYTAMAKQLEEGSKVMHSNNKEFFDKIEQELAKDAPDRDVLYKYMQQISKNEDQQRLKRMDLMIQLRKELTPKQKTKLEKIIKNRHGRERKDAPN